MNVEAVGNPRIAVGVEAPAAPPVRPDAGLTRLVARARLGSSSAFEELVREFAPRIYRFLVLRLPNESDARDALQETLIAAWQGLPRLREVERFWPWLAGIAARKAADSLRRRPAVPSELSAEWPAPELATKVELKAEIADLSPALRDVVLLRYLLQLSEDETAAALGVRVGTVKSRAARARPKIADVIGDDA